MSHSMMLYLTMNQESAHCLCLCDPDIREKKIPTPKNICANGESIRPFFFSYPINLFYIVMLLSIILTVHSGKCTFRSSRCVIIVQTLLLTSKNSKILNVHV